MENNRLSYLLSQYAENKCSRSELSELLTFADKAVNNDQLKAAFEELAIDLDEMIPDFVDKDAILKNIIAQGRIQRNQKPGMLLTWAAAACLFSILLSSIYYMNNGKDPERSNKVITVKIVPGGNRATLKLTNGQTILLDTLHNGLFAKQGSAVLSQPHAGLINYQVAQPISNPVFSGNNILTTPKGGQYAVILSDGTKVWLNACSSLNYPSEFYGKERRVVLTGEGYFEVAKNKDKPFMVTVNNMEVRVLGTHFNIMAYNDEASVNTTLLEGSVKVIKGKNSRMISPGEQAIVNNQIKVIKIDAAKEIAWQRGRFNFSHDSIYAIMRKISRWYNVDVEYHGSIPDYGLVGEVPRSENLRDLLNTFELTNQIHFSISERKVIVTP